MTQKKRTDNAPAPSTQAKNWQEAVVYGITQNPFLTGVITLAFLACISMFVVAFLQGRNISFLPPSIGPFPTPLPTPSSSVVASSAVVTSTQAITRTDTEIAIEAFAGETFNFGGRSVDDDFQRTFSTLSVFRTLDNVHGYRLNFALPQEGKGESGIQFEFAIPQEIKSFEYLRFTINFKNKKSSFGINMRDSDNIWHSIQYDQSNPDAQGITTITENYEQTITIPIRSNFPVTQDKLVKALSFNIYTDIRRDSDIITITSIQLIYPK